MGDSPEKTQSQQQLEINHIQPTSELDPHLAEMRDLPKAQPLMHPDASLVPARDARNQRVRSRPPAFLNQTPHKVLADSLPTAAPAT